MGGIPNPCAGCGDVTCSCCIGDSSQIEVLSGTGNPADCFSLGIVTGAIPDILCDEAVASGTLEDGDGVAVIQLADTCQLQRKTFQGACAELNALPAAVGPAVPGDEVVIFDGATCVRKTITPSDCPPSATPDLGDCVEGDLVPVFCFDSELKTLPAKESVVEDLVADAWAEPLVFLAEDTPDLMVTSAVMTLTNPSCLYDMNVTLDAAPGRLDYYGATEGAFNVLIEESVDGGAFTAIHTVYGDYRGLGSPADFRASQAIPPWNRSYTLAPGVAKTYQWRMTITQTETPVAAIVENFSSRVVMLGVSV